MGPSGEICGIGPFGQSVYVRPIDFFYEGGCQGYSFPYLGVVGPDIRVPHDAQQVDHPGDDDKSFLLSTPLLFFYR